MASDQIDKIIKLIVKTSQIKETFEISEKAKVNELKVLVSEKFKSDINQLCLIFAGKILKDNETLEQHKITDGLTIHLVIRKKTEDTSSNKSVNTTLNNTSTTNISTNTTSSNSNSYNFSNISNGNFENRGGSIFDSPEIQSFLSNPETIRTMINSNPEIQQLLERNPELNHYLNNGEFLRQSFEILRNPAAFQELMRTQDRALSNLESIPGGYNALRRIYTELQEPMLNVAQGQISDNPFASFANQNSNNSNNITNTQSGTENRDPLPNPWSRNTNENNSAPNPSNRIFSTDPELYYNLLNMTSNQIEDLIYNPNLDRILNNQEMLSNLVNPEVIQRTINSPETRRDMERIISNSMQTNPDLSNSFRQLYQEIAQGNPEMMRSLIDLTREQIQSRRNLMNSRNAVTTSDNRDSITTTTTTSTTSNNTAQTNTTSISNINSISQLMSQMLSNGRGINLNANRPSNLEAPEVRYRNELEQLNSMGFTNRQQNINALIDSLGDINGAVEKLLQSRSHSS